MESVLLLSKNLALHLTSSTEKVLFIIRFKNSSLFECLIFLRYVFLFGESDNALSNYVLSLCLNQKISFVRILLKTNATFFKICDHIGPSA